MKKHAAFLVFAITLTNSLFSQQITRFAVVDLPKIYTSFYRDSKAVRELEDKKAKVQAEIDKMGQEIKALRQQKVEAETAQDKQKALALDTEIYKKSEFVSEYYRSKTAEIEDQKKKLFESAVFVQQVYREIQNVAEADGYTMVLNLKATDSIIWYSASVDITDKVIQNLTAKSKP